jgi:hypothetical protein
MKSIMDNNDTIKEMLTAMATMQAHKCIVERIVIGENTFDNSAQSQWPFSRLDRNKANYFRFFRESCLPNDIEEEDKEYHAALQFLDNFLKAYEMEDEAGISKYGTLFFDSHLKQKTPDFVEYSSYIEETYKEALSANPMDETKKTEIAALKSTFSLKFTLTTYRRLLAEICLESNMKFSTLEENIEIILYSTILLMEQYLQAEGIKINEIQQMWESCGFFSDFWFAATLPNEEGNCSAIRQLYQDISDDWPEYIANAIYILDYAAIIQDRLFSNRHMNPDIDWEKESYRIWNSYAAAALRLGEIFSKYKNHLPFVDDEITKLREKAKSPNPLIITEGKTDWKHIKNALNAFQRNAQFTRLKLEFLEYDFDMGGPSLLRMCQEYAKTPQNRKVIFIADFDDESIIKTLGAPTGDKYKSWGNNVFSFCLPVPSQREKYNYISIEYYYSDDEIKHVDDQTQKRLFFSNEVVKIIKSNLTRNKSSAIEYHVCPEIQADEYNKKIYDDECDKIVNGQGQLAAHSKSVFADYVYFQHKGYDNFNLDEFTAIFNIIQDILTAYN